MTHTFETDTCLCRDGHHPSHDPWQGYSGCFYGTIPDQMPWERDGLSFCAFGWSDAQTAWGMNKNAIKDIDMVGDIADFYLLDAIRWDVANPRPVVKKKVSPYVQLHMADKWRDCCDTRHGDAKHAPGCTASQKFDAGMSDEQARDVMSMIALFQQIPMNMKTVRARAWLRHVGLADRMADYLRRYAHYAIAGELTHFGKMKQVFSVNYDEARAGWFRIVEHIGGAKAAKYAKELFSLDGWANAYGGKAWAQIADVLYRYESGQWDAWLFVDRMITLQHNTGSALNKVDWPYNGPSGWYPATMNEPGRVLDAHADSNLRLLLVAASDGVTALFKDYWTLANNDWSNRGEAIVPMPTAATVKCSGTYCSEWGAYDNNLCKMHADLAANQPVPVTLECAACSKTLTAKEQNNKDSYGHKCELCAKTNNCSSCGKAILPHKSICDGCKNQKQVDTDKKEAQIESGAWAEYYATPASDGAISKIVGYTLNQPNKQTPKKSKPKKKFTPAATGSLTEKIKAAQKAAMENMPLVVVDENE